MKKDKPISNEAKPLNRLEELERENLYLKAEIDFLKKLDALTIRYLTGHIKNCQKQLLLSCEKEFCAE